MSVVWRVYKPGQGMRARLAALAGFGLVAFFLATWLHGELKMRSAAVYYGIPIGVAALIVLLGLWLVNRPKLADLLIETELELHKVSWSNRKDLWKSTWVVIFAIFFMAGFMFLVVRVLEPIFYRIHVLERETTATSLYRPGGGNVPREDPVAARGPADADGESTPGDPHPSA